MAAVAMGRTVSAAQQLLSASHPNNETDRAPARRAECIGRASFATARSE